MYRIRAFGDEQVCHSPEELRDVLTREYCGGSISVVYRTAATGMLRIHFIDVLANGQAVASYGDKAPVDFAAMEADTLGPESLGR